MFPAVFLPFFLGLETAAIVARRQAQMFAAVAAEVGERGEIHAVGDLGERQTLVVQIPFQYRYGVAVDEGGDAVTRDPLDGGGEIFRRHVEAPGIVAHVAFGAADARSQQLQQSLHNPGRAVGVATGGFASGVSLEDVINQREAEAAHQFAMEGHAAVVHPVAQPVEVCQDVPGLTVGEPYDRVPVERDAAPDAVVVGGQEVLQEPVVGGKPLHPHVVAGRKIADAVGRGNHHQVVPHDMVAVAVEHQAPFARRAQQVHAGVAQLSGVYAAEVGGKIKIRVHGRCLWRKITLYSGHKQRNCEKSENCGAFCETRHPEIFHTFAA